VQRDSGDLTPVTSSALRLGIVAATPASPGSVSTISSHAGRVVWSLSPPGPGRSLVASADHNAVSVLDPFDGERIESGGWTVLTAPVTPQNASALRRALPVLQPAPIGLATSAGFGDRLGLATPGHARALRAVGGGIVPVFAQQSIREMTRTGRSAQQVIDDATWGALEAGWTDGYGADADHLKTTADATTCAAAGFTFFTVDPGEHVDNGADAASDADLRAAWDALPWDRLGDAAGDLLARHAGTTVDVEGTRIAFDERTVVKAAVKYGRAIAHVAMMYRHVQSVMAGRPFDFEVSVDETETPTSHAEHIFVAKELRRLGVVWQSLAPRFVGRFEKGVDYIGDPAAIRADVAVHAAISRACGPYKISLHSGSDKFSIYDVMATETRGFVHLKTAGTSYLEALRAVAEVSPALFRGIYAFSRERYGEDRASYHVSAQVGRTPAPDAVADRDLAGLLDDFDVRQVLHVTFGSVLTSREPDGAQRFAPSILTLLRDHPEAYAACLERHFVRHLRPFASVAAAR
jgi:tagaturonate epimerase